MTLKTAWSEKISITEMQRLKTACARIKKSPAPEDTLRSRLVNGNKHCPNMENTSINSY